MKNTKSLLESNTVEGSLQVLLEAEKYTYTQKEFWARLKKIHDGMYNAQVGNREAELDRLEKSSNDLLDWGREPKQGYVKIKKK